MSNWQLNKLKSAILGELLVALPYTAFKAGTQELIKSSPELTKEAARSELTKEVARYFVNKGINRLKKILR